MLRKSYRSYRGISTDLAACFGRAGCLQQMMLYICERLGCIRQIMMPAADHAAYFERISRGFRMLILSYSGSFIPEYRGLHFFVQKTSSLESNRPAFSSFHVYSFHPLIWIAACFCGKVHRIGWIEVLDEFGNLRKVLRSLNGLGQGFPGCAGSLLEMNRFTTVRAIRCIILNDCAAVRAYLQSGINSSTEIE